MFRAQRAVRLIGIGGVILAALAFQGCSVYYNTYFNAEKAHGQALRLRHDRLDRNPEDTVVVSPEEKAKLDRTIAKSSKVLELWPDNKKYAPKAVFLIADSYLLMEEYDEAAPKYAEFLRYYPTHEQAPLARVRMAKALYMNRQTLNARDVLADVMAANPKGEVRREAYLLSAQMQVDEDSPAEGLALYERLLAEGAFTSPESRAEAHWQAALLAARLERWESARAHATVSEISVLPVRTQFRNRKFGILALYELSRHEEGLTEIRSMLKDKRFRALRPELVLLQARGHDGKGEWREAERLYLQAARMGESRSAVGAEAFYRMGEHYWEKENDELTARALFDSAGYAGTRFEFGARGLERANALSRIIQLREPDTTGADSARPHYRDFMMAEVFFFDLQRPDSARVHLGYIAADTTEDTVYTRRGLYALAYIEENAFANTVRAHELYRALMARYPATAWAKQAEINLGLPSTIRTDDDLAHELFLQAEERRLAGAPPATVLPMYRQIVEKYPGTRDAPKAQWVVANLAERIAMAPPQDPAAFEVAKAEYAKIKVMFNETDYSRLANIKLVAAEEAMNDGPPADGSSTPPPPEETFDDETADGDSKPSRETLDPQGEEDLY